MTQLPFVTLDVFTTHRFAGNPLAIVTVPPSFHLIAAQKQAVAREFNLSETVFLYDDDIHETDTHPGSRASDEPRLEIFTTTMELPFAGHPVVGTMCYLGRLRGRDATDGDRRIGAGIEREREMRLRCKAGLIGGRYDPVGDVAAAEVPSEVHVHGARVKAGDVVHSQPGLKDWFDGRSEQVTDGFPIVSLVKGMAAVLIDVGDVQSGLGAVGLSSVPIPQRACALDDGWGSAFVAPYYYVVWHEDRDGVGVGRAKVRARMIEADMGEDPATGSAAATLGCYLALTIGGKRSVYEYDIEQGVEMGRRSMIRVRVELDASGKGVERVLLSGSAVLVMQGTICV